MGRGTVRIRRVCCASQQLVDTEEGIRAQKGGLAQHGGNTAPATPRFLPLIPISQFHEFSGRADFLKNLAVLLRCRLVVSVDR